MRKQRVVQEHHAHPPLLQRYAHAGRAVEPRFAMAAEAACRCIKPATHRNSVLLPLPEGFTSASNFGQAQVPRWSVRATAR